MQPVYGPSTPSPYQQFYDVSTGMPIQPQLVDPASPTEHRMTYQRNAPRSSSPYSEDYESSYYGGVFTPFGRHSPTSPLEVMPRTSSSAVTMEDAYARLAHEDSFPAPPSMPRDGSCTCVYCAPPPLNEDIPNPPVPSATAIVAPAQAPPAPATDRADSDAAPPEHDATPNVKGNGRPRSDTTPRREARRGKKKTTPSGATPSASPNLSAASPAPSTASPKTEPKRVGGGRGASRIANLLGHHDRPIIARTPVDLEEGDYVVFEGDRGVDMGRVQSVSDVSARPDVTRASGLPLVLRSATHDEVKTWTTTLSEDAAAAIPVCQEAADRLGIRITVTSASYQFDRLKLTFFYNSPQRVDFRRMLSPLFTKYRCRIWLERNE